MMRKLAFILLLASASAHAQFTPGQILTAAELNSQFARYVPIAGATLTGPLTAPALITASASITGGAITGLSSPIPLGSGGTGANTATGATSNLQYLPSFSGAVARSLTAKLADRVSVCDFQGCGQSGDVSAAFQGAVNALPSAGGEISVPDGTYTVATAPTIGTKSVYWNFGPNVVVTGNSGTWPAELTNTGVLPVGPWIVSQSPVVASATNSTAAFSVESWGPSSLNGGMTAMYNGANLTSSGANAFVQARNTVVTAQSGSSGNIWGDEIDVGMFATTGTGTQFGLSFNGLGTGNPTFGIKFDRADTSKWQQAIDIRNAQIGINIENTTGMNNALVAGSIPTIYAGTTAMIGQMANSGAALILQRYTNTSPTGYLINAINANNTGQLYSLDTGGNVYAGGNTTHSGVERDLSYTINAPTTGTTVTMATGSETAIIAPSGALASLTITLPACAASYDGALARFSTTAAITALTVNATAGAVIGAPTTLAANVGHGFLCRGANTTWYPLY